MSYNIIGVVLLSSCKSYFIGPIILNYRLNLEQGLTLTSAAREFEISHWNIKLTLSEKFVGSGIINFVREKVETLFKTSWDSELLRNFCWYLNLLSLLIFAWIHIINILGTGRSLSIYIIWLQLSKQVKFDEF